jgi:hypothetical protein
MVGRNRVPWRVVAGPGCLMASGLLAVAAAVQRWWPACVPGDLDSLACLTMQDSAHDFMVPNEGWAPGAGAAALYGVGLLLLAVACVVLPGLLVGSAPGLQLTVASWVVALGTAVVGAVTTLSGVRGQVVTVPGHEVAAVLWVLGPIVLATLGLVSGRLTSGRFGWRMGAVAALVVGNPVAQFLFAPAILGYVSHDTTPWAEAVGGAGLALGGAFLLVACRPAPHPATGPIRSTPYPMI